MSTENTPDEIDNTNLDDFAAEFFGQTKADPEPTNSEVEQEQDADSDALNNNTQDADDTDDADTDDSGETNEEDADDEEDEQDEPAPKPKKNRFQERIDELTNARREAERKAQAAEDRIAALEAKLNGEPTEPKPAPKAAEGPTRPEPTDLNEDGTEKYPLGEFDPLFITDLADFRVEQRFAEREQQQQEQANQRKAQEARQELETQWSGQLDTARERYPDFDDKGVALGEMLVNVDGAYGEYLGATLMSMDKGADVLYFLASNPELAQEIVNSGPQKATIALGRLEAQFMTGEGQEEPSTPPKKVTKAPTPPPQARGAATARGAVRPDTDDLDAFSDMFFNQKK